MTTPLDAASTAAAIQDESYRQLGEAGRLRVALQLSDLTHSFALAGVKDRNPGITDEGARRMLAAMLYDPAVHDAR